MKSIVASIILTSIIAGNAFGSECFLYITYKNSKEKTIKIDLEKETATEQLFKKLSGSLLIEILVKSDSRREKITIIDVLEMQTGVRMTTASNTLSVGRDAYKANIMCVDEIF